MKFISLGTKGSHRRGQLDEPSQATLERSIKPMAMPPPHQIHTYAELRKQIHDDLRIQHPEWVESNGESSMRLLEMLDTLTRTGSNDSVAAVRRALEQGLKLNRHRAAA